MSPHREVGSNMTEFFTGSLFACGNNTCAVEAQLQLGLQGKKRSFTQRGAITLSVSGWLCVANPPTPRLLSRGHSLSDPHTQSPKVHPGDLVHLSLSKVRFSVVSGEDEKYPGKPGVLVSAGLKTCNRSDNTTLFAGGSVHKRGSIHSDRREQQRRDGGVCSAQDRRSQGRSFLFDFFAFLKSQQVLHHQLTGGPRTGQVNTTHVFDTAYVVFEHQQKCDQYPPGGVIEFFDVGVTW